VHFPRVVEDDVEDVQLVLRVHPDVSLVAGHAIEGLGTLFTLVEAPATAAISLFCHTSSCHFSKLLQTAPGLHTYTMH
jgi:hypothetical protein